jgi:hypothetical protein
MSKNDERGEEYICRVTFVGQDSTGTRNVTFEWANGGNMGSDGWPEWAWLIAKDALLFGKKVVIVASGPPASDNFSYISLMSESATK